MAGFTFGAYRRSVLPSIEARLNELVEGELSDLYHYAVEGGKRLRPSLTLLLAEALDGDPRMALDLACSVELTHCASLALDDILDWHEERRGKVALHRLQGLQTAVTTGFTMPSLALNLAARYGVEYPRMLTDAWVSMCMGVYREAAPDGISWKSYREGVELKTAKLFATACAFGAKAASSRGRSFEEYGLRLGRAFQMADDLADGFRGRGAISEDRLRKEMEREANEARRLTRGWKLGNPDLLEAIRDAPWSVVSSMEVGDPEGP